jgi:hypothetical protein
MRLLGLLLIVGLLGLSAVGCSRKSGVPGEALPGEAPRSGDKPSKRSEAEAKKGDWKKEEAKKGDLEKDIGPRAVDPPAPMAEAVAGTAKSAKALWKSSPQSGILTAGSFDDNLDPAPFHSFLSRFSQDRALGDIAGRLRSRRLLILVKDETGQPIGNARVKLVGRSGSPIELITRSDGRAVSVLGWDRILPGEEVTVSVIGPSGSSPVMEVVPAGVDRWEVTLPTARGELPRNLDLAIVLDTTGSMGDELSYLKSEIRGISTAIRKQFPHVQQRYSLVVYRDEGDDYVARPFDFTSSLDTFHRRLAGQKASGGGDYPEAMHRGLEEASKLTWRDAGTARLLFLIADAPPHTQHLSRTLAAADALRRRGVAIYPVACSGYDDTAEFVMRACALFTGSQFLFLTDDSGVGAAHGEPHIPYFQVQRLDRLMIRMIAAELSGRRIDAHADEVIRTVGRKIN